MFANSLSNVPSPSVSLLHLRLASETFVADQPCAFVSVRPGISKPPFSRKNSGRMTGLTVISTVATLELVVPSLAW
ncbi:MAG: hypothetical protein B6D42_15890 [Anaerolineae bacterium UTCFX5]|nr:MAG: hypothetical protein B6D42_15890 [Anaerolineae bacterium UTCFX5]